MINCTDRSQRRRRFSTTAVQRAIPWGVWDCAQLRLIGNRLIVLDTNLHRRTSNNHFRNWPKRRRFRWPLLSCLCKHLPSLDFDRNSHSILHRLCLCLVCSACRRKWCQWLHWRTCPSGRKLRRIQSQLQLIEAMKYQVGPPLEQAIWALLKFDFWMYKKEPLQQGQTLIGSSSD